MKIYKDLEQRSEEWHQARKGKITGTGLKKLLGSKTLREGLFWDILSQRLSNSSDSDEPDFLRGQRLEAEAIEEFEKRTGKLVEIVGMTVSDENENIASSPDGLIKNGKKYTEAVEIKCLSSKNHVKYCLDDTIPDEYYPQVVQYFIVNEDLETLYFVLYDPRITPKPYRCIEVTRDEVHGDICNYLGLQNEFLREIDAKVDELIKI